jgi:Na+/H+ antiporter NhaD/arsenite permease-like protein
MFLVASEVRALLGPGLAMHGGFVGQLADRAVLACAKNLPAAAASCPPERRGPWAAILATTIGPNLLVTGSMATMITRRRIARDSGATLAIWRFSLIGAALVPAQLAAATLGLHITGILR